jgi:predicted ester cyclase
VSIEDNKATVRRWFDCWSRGNLEEFSELYSPDARGQSTRQNWNWVFDVWRAGFSDFHYQVEDVVAEGDTVAVNAVCSGTHDGVFELFKQPWPPSGRQMSVREIVFFWLVDGKIVNLTSTWGELQFLRQLEVNPAFLEQLQDNPASPYAEKPLGVQPA